MTKVNYQASCMRGHVRLFVPSAESKNFSESNFCTLAIRERINTCEDGREDRQYVLFAESQHPTFSMGAMLPLTGTTPEVGEEAMRVPTQTLERALASFGTKECQLQVVVDDDPQQTDFRHGVRLLTLCTDDDGVVDEKHPVKELLVRGQSVQECQLPEQLQEPTAVMPDMLPLLDGLRSAVEVASTRGNSPKQQGVRLTLSPECLCVEATSPIVKATTHYADRWQQAPTETQSFVITTDAVRHIIAAFSQLGTGSPLRMKVDKLHFTLQCRNVTFICDTVCD